MKIAANPSGVASRAAPPVRPAAPTAAGRFEALLAGDPSRSADNQRALGFGELGVFARPATLGAGTHVDRPESHAAPPQAEADDTNADVAVPEAVTSTASPAPRALRLQACADAIRACLDQASGSQEPGACGPIAVLSPIPESTPSGSVAGLDEGPAPAIAPRARVARPASSQVSLILAEDGQGLKVLAAGFQIPPALGERLRQRISDLAAEHGLTLSDLLMDGQPTVAPSFNFQGAIHGDYAR